MTLQRLSSTCRRFALIGLVSAIAALPAAAGAATPTHSEPAKRLTWRTPGLVGPGSPVTPNPMVRGVAPVLGSRPLPAAPIAAPRGVPGGARAGLARDVNRIGDRVHERSGRDHRDRQIHRSVNHPDKHRPAGHGQHGRRRR